MPEEEHIERIDSEISRHIAEVLGGYYTGSDISRLFAKSGLDDMHYEGMTKWVRIEDAFEAAMLGPDGLSRVFVFIENCMNPVKFIGNDAAFTGMRESLDEALSYAGYGLDRNGKISKTSDGIGDETSVERIHTMTVSPIWGAFPIAIESLSCFVIMPFTDELDGVYQSIVKPAIEAEGFTVTRADDIRGNAAVMVDIWHSICRARFVVADLTARNPNVFYELGIAHTVGKDTIMIAQQEEASIPFDISHIRRIRYRNDASGGVQLSTELRETIATVTRSTAPR